MDEPQTLAQIREEEPETRKAGVYFVRGYGLPMKWNQETPEEILGAGLIWLLAGITGEIRPEDLDIVKEDSTRISNCRADWLKQLKAANLLEETEPDVYQVTETAETAEYFFKSASGKYSKSI